MRVPTQERRPFKVRGWMIAIVVILLVLLFSLRGLAVFYTDFLWFDSLGQSGTWGDLLTAKLVPAVVFTVVFFVLLLANLMIADRLAPKVRGLAPPTPEDELVIRYQSATARYRGRIRVLIALFFALIAGIGVAAQWREWILFTNSTEFGEKDAQFGRDIGFYVFKLPFIEFIIDWLFAGLVIVLLVTAVAHYLNGGIRFQSPMQRVTPQVKAHISVILAIMALVKTADYYFTRYALTLSDRGTVQGATYTDVNAQLPALEFLTVVSVIAALLFLWNIWRRGWVLPVIAVGLWAFISLIVGTLYPAAIQNFKVEPDELATEQPFIRRNIEATRAAFGLEDVDVKQFDYTTLDPESVGVNVSTIDNARLWDPDTIVQSYRQLQELQSYYQIRDVDVDRYSVDGQVKQVMIASRDLDTGGIQNPSWVNEHLVFTHGYGAIVSPSAEAGADGDPLFYLSDVPAIENGIELSGKGAQVYFGEGTNEYVIVNADQAEFNFVREGRGGDAQTRYSGADGIEVSNIFKKAAFALRFGDPNPLISSQVNGDSRVLMIRDVRERAEKLAPFIRFDDDPYPIVVDNRMLWVLDGYTTSDRYPYSQLANGGGGLSTEFNYARNSVKATIDAYDGTVTYYVIDPSDPIISTYQKAFPDLFTPQREMPDEVREHLRYPEDLFQVQSDVFARYHVTDARRFYRENDRWLRTPDPNEVAQAQSATSGRRGRSQNITSDASRQDPYYLYLRLPEDDQDSFVLLQPFVPVSGGDQQTRLSSFVTVKSDGDDYGKLEAFVMPQGTQVQGPVQVANDIQNDNDLAQRFSLLNRGESRVVFGEIQLIPVGNSMVYIQSINVQRTERGYPQFEFVIAFAQDAGLGTGDTVAEALADLFGVAPTEPTEPTDPTDPTEPTEPSADSVEELLAQAAEKFAQADAALERGDLAAYEQLEEEGRDLVDQALELLRAEQSSADSSAGAATQASFR